ADSLQLPAREFVAIALHVIRIESNLTQQPRDAFVPFFLITDPVNHQRLSDDVLDLHAPIERGIRILKDDLHLAAQLAQLALAHRGYVASFELNIAACRFNQTKKATARR